MPRREGIVVRIDGLHRVQWDIEAQQHATVHRCNLAWDRRGRACVTYPSQSRQSRRRRSPSKDLEASDIELTVDRIDRTVQRRKVERASDADDSGLRLGAAVVEQNSEQLWVVESDVNQSVVQRPHLRVEQPYLRHR